MGVTLGCIAFLLRKKWTKPVLLISLIGVLVQITHSFFMSNSEVYDSSDMIMPIMVLLISIALIFFVRKSEDYN